LEVSALKPAALPALRGPSALLRLQSDERLIAMIRRGQHGAFEALFSRYHARLLAFCRHMLGCKEDAEDVLQEVFTAAFNAILADEREINVRPWLYRIARNRSLNHLRKASAIGVDSMDVHFAEGGISTGEKVLRRESFRQLISDVQQLPETQRTALLLREIDALSYDQIAEAMETTIPSVKSLLVRARISLAEAAEARQLTCEQVRQQLGEAAEGVTKLSAPARRHMRSCERCRGFRKQLKSNNVALAAVMPVGAALLLRKLLSTKLGASHVAGGASAGAAAGGGSAAGGFATAGVGTLAGKAVAGLAAAALVTAGAVEAGHSGPRHRPLNATAPIAQTQDQAASTAAPTVVHTFAQPASSFAAARIVANDVGGKQKALVSHHRSHTKIAKTEVTALSSSTQSTTSIPAGGAQSAPSVAASAPPTTEVVTETTQLQSTSSTAATSTTSTTTTSSAASATTSAPPATGGSTNSPMTTPQSPASTPQQAGGTAAPVAGGTVAPVASGTAAPVVGASAGGSEGSEATSNGE
jgi:RNA polymerase sigma factor (sigma-70 family)